MTELEQHFLTNPDKLRALVAAAQIKPGDRVLELGSGGGTVAAALPPCTLILTELDDRLARSLRLRFPSASVVAGNALAVLEDVEADVILSNLPHTLTHAVLSGLSGKTFGLALVAVHKRDELDVLSAVFSKLRLEPRFTLRGRDFTPPQPFPSKLLRVTRR